MNKVFVIVALPLLVLSGSAQSRNCLRVMPIEELTRNSILIARVKVLRADPANYRGSFSQIARLKPVEVIEGDFTLKELHVLARSNVQCAEDNYTAGQEMLVFLKPEESLFLTVNFQHGQFLIVNEIVKGWRDSSNKPVDRPYAEVRQEIEQTLDSLFAPPTTPAEVPQPSSPPPLR